jgi:DNA-binding beta-propeller fold protein YncE
MSSGSQIPLKTQQNRQSQKIRQTQAEPRRPLRRLALLLLALAASIAIIIGITVLLIYRIPNRARHDAKPVAQGVAVATFVTLADDNSFPMGLAAASSDAANGYYVSLFGTGAVMKVDEKGALTPFITAQDASLTASGAIAVGPDKAVYVIDYSSTDLRHAKGTIKRIAPDGKVAPFGNVLPNQILPLWAQMTFDAAGNLYVTDPATSEIWQFDPRGTRSVLWNAAPLAGVRGQPTGIAYDAARNALVVGDAGTGSIYRLVLTSGAPNVELLHRQTGLDVQAVALDDQGRVLFTAWENDDGKLYRVEANGAPTLLADGFRTPTSLVFRDGKVYVVNSDMLGLAPPILGFIPSPLQAKPPFTVDAIDLSGALAAPTTSTPVKPATS